MSDPIPPLAFVVFGLAFASGLGFFACLYLVARRLGLKWERRGSSYVLEDGGFRRIAGLAFGRERAPEGTGPLIWGMRLAWLAMPALILLFAYMIGGFA